MSSAGIESQHYEQAELWGTEHVALPEHLALRIEAVQRLVPVAPPSILEVGAGDGRVLNALSTDPARASTWFVGCDRSLQALHHVEVDAALASAEALPFRDRSFDTVLCFEVLEHLPRPIYDATRVELARVTANRLIISVPNREHRRRAEIRCPACDCAYNADRHLRSFSPDDLVGLFQGFAITATDEFGPRQPWYPRSVRALMERRGLLPRLGSPTCPQCGEPYPYTATSGSRSPDRDAPARPSAYTTVRRMMPKVRHPYWLAAVYERR